MKQTKCMYCNKKLAIPDKAREQTAKCRECHKIWHKLRSRYSLYGKGITVHDLVMWYVAQPQECSECKSTEKITIDRIKPGKDGGLYELDNIQLLCYSCNSLKKRGYATIEEANREVTEKRCRVCQTIKPLSTKYFHRTSYRAKYAKNPLSEYHPVCKECRLRNESLRYANSHPIPRRPGKVKYTENYPSIKNYLGK